MNWQSLLPPNSSQLERDLEATITESIWSIPIDLNKILRPYECPIELLPWLAWTLSVDQWDIGWLEATKRQVVAESFAIHQKKGTRWAVERLLSITGHNNVEIIEWWQTQPKGTPHTFYMQIPSSPGFDPVILSENQYKRIRKVVDSVKPVRSRYRFSITSKFAVIKPPKIIDDGSSGGGGGGSGGISVDGSCPVEAGIAVPALVCYRDAKTMAETDHRFYCIPYVPTESGATIRGNNLAKSISAVPTNLLKADVFAKPSQKINWKESLNIHTSTQPCTILIKDIVARAKQNFAWTKNFQANSLFQTTSVFNGEMIL